MTKEETDNHFNKVTANGCREMDDHAFNQAVNEIITEKLMKITKDLTSFSSDLFNEGYYAWSDSLDEIIDNITPLPPKPEGE